MAVRAKTLSTRQLLRRVKAHCADQAANRLVHLSGVRAGHWSHTQPSASAVLLLSMAYHFSRGKHQIVSTWKHRARGHYRCSKTLTRHLLEKRHRPQNTELDLANHFYEPPQFSDSTPESRNNRDDQADQARSQRSPPLSFTEQRVETKFMLLILTRDTTEYAVLQAQHANA